jgi:hypothetical protein
VVRRCGDEMGGWAEVSPRPEAQRQGCARELLPSAPAQRLVCG